MSVLTSPEHRSEYLSVAEIAETLGVSAPTIRRRIASGELPAVKLGRGRNCAVRVSRDAVAEWLAAAYLEDGPES